MTRKLDDATKQVIADLTAKGYFPNREPSEIVKLTKMIDRYGIALMMIANGAGDPKEVAERALAAVRKLAGE